jgi:CheY-like chemotaxis protein
MNLKMLLKLIFSALLLLLAGFRVAYYDTIGTHMDAVFFGLVFLSFLIFFIPWERLSSFKAGGIEISLSKPEVQAAIRGLGLVQIDNKQLKRKLASIGDKLLSVQGGKVLWIDDKPHNLVGAKRLLRALGIQIVSATSTEMAESILSADNDFDMIITDVQRIGESYKLNDGVDIHEGVNFVVKLREHEDPVIKTLPVIFYAAYDWERLVEFTRPARELQPEAEIANSSTDFIPKVIERLAEVRMFPIVCSGDKIPTDAN